MFENKTYESLLDEALDRVTSDVDKREGSLIYDAIAPSIYMLAQMYVQLDCYTDLFFADTAIGDYLDRIVATVGLARKTDESDEALRARYYDKVRTPAASGNSSDYRIWAMSIENVGNAKVIPLWNGPGTVKVLIVNTDFEVEESLETIVANYIETVRPVGAAVTVDSPIVQSINVSATVVHTSSITDTEIKNQFEVMLKEYVNSLIFKTYTVSIAKIGALLLEIDGVADYTSLTINGSTSNITISDTGIPQLGTVTITQGV